MQCLAALILLFYSYPLLCNGRRWNAKSVSSQSPSQTDRVLTPEEIAALLRAQGSLDDYSRKPDCFKKAAALIQAHCAELDMNESERVNGKFYCYADASALSRSAQFWSSYSGYLRETRAWCLAIARCPIQSDTAAAQLCFAFRRWNDIDVARDVYRNTTLEQAAFLQHISAREKVAEMSVKVLESRIDDLQEVVAHIRLAANDIDSCVDHMESRLNTKLDHTLNMFKDALSLLQKEQEHIALYILNQTSGALVDLYQGVCMPITYRFCFTVVYLDNRVLDQWASLGSGLNGLIQARILNQTQADASMSADALTNVLSNLAMATRMELEKVANASAGLLERNASLQAENDTLSWLILGLKFLKSVVYAPKDTFRDRKHHKLINSQASTQTLVFAATFRLESLEYLSVSIGL
ncbi:hypothetical protein DXG01_016344 [Tephrocybe rancida]|nr:hypothetical protein DXG01_016344 [Tephrocybe rancida]